MNDVHLMKLASRGTRLSNAIVDTIIFNLIIIAHAFFFDWIGIVIMDKVARSRNKIRNELKHNDSGQDTTIKHDFQFEAETFILAAIRNYELIYGKLPNDRIIKRFWNWISM